MIKLGDRVKFINDVGVGKVIKIEGKIVTVDREDGFEVPTIITELVVVDKAEEMRVIDRIGVSDYKPGRVKRAQKEKAAPQERLHEGAINRYGRVTITNDYEDEDEPIDIYAIRENYARSRASINQYMLENEDKEPVNDTSIFDEPSAQAVEEDYEAVKIEKKAEKPEPKQVAKPAKKSDIEVVDLHAHEILETEQGLGAKEILDYQIDTFRSALRDKLTQKRHCKMVFIHGVGSGKLKYEITRILRSEFADLYFQDASFKEYGYGAIMVIV